MTCAMPLISMLMEPPANVILGRGVAGIRAAIPAGAGGLRLRRACCCPRPTASRLANSLPLSHPGKRVQRKRRLNIGIGIHATAPITIKSPNGIGQSTTHNSTVTIQILIRNCRSCSANKDWMKPLQKPAVNRPRPIQAISGVVRYEPTLATRTAPTFYAGLQHAPGAAPAEVRASFNCS
jgi:hypothetical protein